MSETIRIHLPGKENLTGLTAKLRRKDTAAVINGAGDALTESPSGSASFTFTLAEDRTGLGMLRCDVEDGTGIIGYQWLDEEETVGQDTDLSPSINFTAAQFAALTVETGVIGNFPDELIIGDSYSVDTGRIRIEITDVDGEPLNALGSLNFADADISFIAFRPDDTAVIEGECEFVDEGDSTYVLLSLSASATAEGKAEYTYEGRLQFYWSLSSGEADDERKTFKTTPFKFIENIV